jgi:hypothetical protein
MTMEKYGVSDKKELQEKELQTVQSRLKVLRSSHEKTADQTQEVEQLERRESEISVELQSAE